MSFGSDASVPGMVDDHGSEVSVEDEYQYHATGAELWDSFWKASPRERLSRMRSYPALIKLPAGHCGYHHPHVYAQQQQQQQQRAGWDHPQTPTSYHVHEEQKEPAWPLPTPAEHQPSPTPAARIPNASWSVFPRAVADSMGRAMQPRTSSRLGQGAPSTPTNPPSTARVSAHGAHASRSSLASSSPSSASTRTSVGTASTAPSTVASPPPSAPDHHQTRPSLARTAKKRPSLGNLRKLGTTLAASIARGGSPQTQQQYRHARGHSQPQLEPRAQHQHHHHRAQTRANPPVSSGPSTPTTQRPAPPPPPPPPCRAPPPPPLPPADAPLVSVFEYDSDSDDAGDADSDDDESASFARRIVRGFAHRGRHHHHHHDGGGAADRRRPRSASEGRARSGVETARDGRERTRAGTVGATTAGEGWREEAHPGALGLRRQKSDVFGRMLGRMSR